MFVTRINSTPVGKGRYRMLTAPLIWDDGTHRIEIPTGFIYDLHSVPRLLWRILPPHWYPEAAVLHDYLYATGHGTRKMADQLYLAALTGLDAEPWRRQVMYAGVRVGGGVAWSRWEKLRNSDPSRWKTSTGLDNSAVS